MFPRVARSGTDRVAAPSPWYSTNFPTTRACRKSSVMRRTRSVAVTPVAQNAVKMHAHDVGQQQIHRLAQHRRFGFDSADAPTHYARGH